MREEVRRDALRHHRRRDFGADSFGQRHGVVSLDQRVLRVGATRIHRGDALANVNIAHVRPDGVHRPCRFATRREGQGQLVLALALVDLDEVDARRLDLDADLTRPWLGSWDVFKLERVWSTGRADTNRPHNCPRFRLSPRAWQIFRLRSLAGIGMKAGWAQAASCWFPLVRENRGHLHLANPILFAGSKLSRSLG